MQIMPSAEEDAGARKPAARYQHPGKGQAESKVLPTPSIVIFSQLQAHNTALSVNSLHACELLKPVSFLALQAREDHTTGPGPDGA